MTNPCGQVKRKAIGGKIVALVFCLLFNTQLMAAPGDILWEERFDNNGDYNSDWTEAGGGDADVNNDTFGAAADSLALSDDGITVTSNAGNINANVPAVDFSVWIRRGDDAFSEDPDQDEDLTVEYLNSSGTWVLLATYLGDGTPGEIYTPTFNLSGDALHSGLRVRFSLAAAADNNSDFWHIDDVVFTERAVVPTAEWRMDSAAWSGTAGEVVDFSGNGFSGTAVGGANTDDASPAVAGDPGTCRYGVFDGTDDYVNVSGLSSILNGTASLAFWIRTTQTGSDTAWQAPGVTGVELGGGTDDIFWGWLDASGRIGVSIGNDYTTKSATAINNGAWHHVVITRDHTAGAYKIYIDGSLDASGSIATGVIGTSFDSIGRIEDTGGSPEYFAGDLDEVRVYDRVLNDSAAVAVMNETHACASNICPNGPPSGGIIGKYFNNMTLSGTPAGVRLDTTVDFNWGTGNPGVTGVGTDQFSVRWEGSLRVTNSGNYRFQTESDDGIRLWVDGVLLIDNWTDHAPTIDTTGNVSLTGGQVYSIRLEYYENGGGAVSRLRWRVPGTGGSYVAIPAGPTPTLGSGLYSCPGVPDHYTISASATGVTCEAEPVTITGRDASGAAMTPAAGTEIALSTAPATGTWSGGATHVFDGTSTSVVKPLRQTTASTLDISVTDGTASEIVTPQITFTDIGIRFYGDTSLNPWPNQVAGAADANTVLRVVETSSDTGACVARLDSTTRATDLAYECRDPTTCSAGQTLTLNGSGVQANNNGAAITYTSVNLTFDANGFAAIPFEYSDVGQVRLHAQLALPAEGDDPAVTAMGTSSEFIVKPYTLAVIAAETPSGAANPGGTAGGSGFVAAGEEFVARVEGQNADGARTPAFGREGTPETVQVDVNSLVFPAGGSLGSLSNGSAFTPLAGTPGVYENTTLSWNQVGSMTLAPSLVGGDYLGAGDLAVAASPSATIGRFYPYEYELTAATVSDSCGAFSYMSQPAINMDYTVQARGFGVVGTLSNYDTALGYGGATPVYVAENANDGTPRDGRVSVTDAGQWVAGSFTLSTTAAFAKAVAPDGPYTQVQYGLQIVDTLDGRNLINLDMYSGGSGDCVAASNCNAVALGGQVELRFGRLVLGDAFGPETADLPVSFITEYWDGSMWQHNINDSCTAIDMAAISYPDGTIDNAANLTVNLAGGSTQGNYADTTGGAVNMQNGDAGHFFSAPDPGTGSFPVDVSLINYPWLRFDWNEDNDYSNDTSLPTATYSFGTYRGHDRIIYWRENLQ